MSFEIIKKEIRSLNVDAIVCFEKPGLKLLHAGKLLRILRPGETYMTEAPGQRAAWVIHTVLPVRQEQWDENLLRRCYVQSLELARKKGLRSVAFPLIAAGKCGFGLHEVSKIAVETIREFLEQWDLQVILALSEEEFQGRYGMLAHSLDRFVEANYCPEWQPWEYRSEEVTFPAKQQQEKPKSASAAKMLRPPRGLPKIRTGKPKKKSRRDEEFSPSPIEHPYMLPTEPSCGIPYPSPLLPCIEDTYPEEAPFDPEELNRMVKDVDAGFSETLLDLIDRTGQKDSDVYKRANVDRKLFSKIRNNPNYKPSKATAVAFAIALELDLEETKDLIGRAGYALSRSSKFDIIIEYFITHKRYDILEINMMLYEFDQSLLGA